MAAAAKFDPECSCRITCLLQIQYIPFLGYTLTYFCRQNNQTTPPTSSSQVRRSIASLLPLPQISETHCLRPADTVVLTHSPPGLQPSQFAEELGGGLPQDILEKPIDEEDNMRMLLDLNGGRCEVVTGVTVGAFFLAVAVYIGVPNRKLMGRDIVFPVLEAPGYKIK